MNRNVAQGLAIVGLIVGGVGIAAIAAGQSFPAGPLLGLAYYLSIICVVRPYVYERFGAHVGDWVIVILILGPASVLVAPVLWWEHRRSDRVPSGSPTITG